MREPFLEYIESKLGTDFLLVTCGLPATCKTGAAEIIAKITGYPLLSSDLIRLEVLKDEDIFNEKVAADIDKRTMVYDEMFRQADETLEGANSLILDATFVTESLRRQAAAIAAKHNLAFIILQTDCPQSVSLRRISRRIRENYESNALTEQAYLNNKDRFEEIDLNDLKQLNPNLAITLLVVDTGDDLTENWYVTSVVKK